MDNVFWTVVSGTSVYALGQIVVKFWIEPVHELKRLTGRISNTLLDDARTIHGPDAFTLEQRLAVAQRLRKLAAELEQHLALVPAYHWTARVFCTIPPATAVRSARDNLVGLSNLVESGEDREVLLAYRVQCIKEALYLYVEPGSRITKEDVSAELRRPRPTSGNP